MRRGRVDDSAFSANGLAPEMAGLASADINPAPLRTPLRIPRTDRRPAQWVQASQVVTPELHCAQDLQLPSLAISLQAAQHFFPDEVVCW